jgi:DivIVA domain-containing protein
MARLATIPRMDGTPHLLTDVKFSERRRGYDPEEVDNFLERVSSAVAQLQDKLREATARAEEADARVADAQRAQASAESELARTGSSTASGVASVASADPEGDADKASKILLMAQRTADATIDDANSTAQQAVSEARIKAAGLVAEAEAEAQTTRADAKREAEELIEQRRAVVVREVRELEELKTTVQSDIDILGAHLDDQRARIRRGVEALALVLDDPDGLRAETPPTLHDTTVDDVLAESSSSSAALDTDDGEDEADDDEPVAVFESAIELDDADDEEESIVVLNEGIDVSGVDLTSAPEPARTPGGIFGATSQSTFDTHADAGKPPHLAAVPDDSPDIDLAGDDLFAAADRDDRVGPPTQAFKPFTESDDPLGPPDDEADKAMRAFFEADFETSEGVIDPEQQKSRFGFRR